MLKIQNALRVKQRNILLLIIIILSGFLKADQTLQFPNGRIKVGLGNSGNLSGIYDTFKDNRNVIAPNMKTWSIDLKNIDGKTATIESDKCKASISSTQIESTIIWDIGPGLKEKGFDFSNQIKAICIINVNDSSITMHLKVENNSKEWMIGKVDFPYLFFSKLGSDANDDILMTPFVSGRLSYKPLINGSKCSHWGNYVSYPSAGGAMQVYAYWDTDRGIYFSPEDPYGSKKELWAHSKPNSNFIETKTVWYTEGSNVPGNDFNEPGSFRLELFDGDWYDASQIYRKWVFSKALWRVDENAHRPDTPQWFKENCVWVRSDGGPSEILESTLNFRKFMEVPASLHWYRWHEIPFDVHYPHYFPTKPNMSEAVKKFQAAGIHVVPYINARIWDVDTEDFKDAIPGATKDPNNNYNIERYNPKLESEKKIYGEKRPFAVMCPTTEIWQNKIKEIVLQLLNNKIGVDGVYLDQMAAEDPALCFDISHNHPLGGGSWWTVDGYWPMLTKIREEFVHQHPSAILTSESSAEPYLHKLDGYLTWSQTYENAVPFFSAVYAGNIQLFGRTYGGKDQLAHCMKIGQALNFGEQLGWARWSWVKDNPKPAAFMREAAKTRQKLLPFLSWGKMARPPKVSGEIPDINADWNWLGKPMPVKDSSLQRSAWQAQDGRIAFIFTNVSDNEIGFSWDFKSSDYFKGTKKIEINTFDGRRKPVENTFNKFINIAPQKIVVYIVSQCE